MVAPSPDWFVGVAGLSLLDAQGQWLAERTVDLYPWDAGTEDGDGFSMNNAATAPPGTIENLRGIGKFSAGKMATLTFSRQSVNAAPAFTSDATFSVDENETAVGTVEATDADAGDTVSYAVTGGADSAQFQIGPTTGALRFIAAPDYENPTDLASTDPASAAGNNEYIVVVTATGGTGGRALPAEQIITVTVNDVDESEPAIALTLEIEGPRDDPNFGYLATFPEGGGPVEIGLRAETEGAAPPAKDFVVTFNTVDQSAKEGMDFVAPTLTLTYAFDATDFVLQNGRYVLEVSKDIEIVDDEVVEPLEYFDLIVDVDALPDHVTIPANRVAGGIEIEDNDTLTVSVDDAQAEEGEDIVATVTADGVAELPYTVVVVLPEVEATPTVDYVHGQIVVNFAAGDTEKTLRVETIEDDIVEPDETFQVKMILHNFHGAIGFEQEPHAILTILDDDEPEWAVSVAPAAIAEAGGTSTVTVSTGGVTFAEAQTIGLDFAGGAAAVETDFTVADADGDALASPYQLTLAAGESIVTATITAVDDTDDDDDEQIQVTATRDGEELGEAQTITITDDDEPASMDATLSGLSLLGIALLETFEAGVTEYSASVDHDVTTVTFDATPSDAGTTVEILDADDLRIDDADPVADGHQVDLEVGLNTIRVKLTAADGITTRTYTVKVTRAAANAAPVFTSAPAFPVDENETAVGTVEATDADAGDTVSYAVTGGADQAQFQIGPTTGALSFTAAPDYENPTDLASTDPASAAGDNEYIVVVTATGGAGDRALPAEQIITVTVNDTATAPGAATGLDAVSVGQTDIEMTWTAPSDDGDAAVTGYGIETRTGGTWQRAATTPDAGTSFTLGGLVPGTIYTLRVVAINAAGEGAASNEVESTTDHPLPASVTVPAGWNLTPSGLTGGSRFRLLVVESKNWTCRSRDIGRYNRHFIYHIGLSGHAEIRPYADGFRVLGSTQRKNARDNTGTTGTGVPIYWLNGDKVADDNADLYDGSWGSQAARWPSGTDASSVQSVKTGSLANGTRHATIFLGAGHCAVGKLFAGSEMYGGASVSNNDTANPFYVLSQEFVVSTSTPTITSIALTSDPNNDNRDGDDDTYAIGDTIEATVTFSEAVTVDELGGTPQLALDVGGETRQADYGSGSGSTALVFSYSVAEGDEDNRRGFDRGGRDRAERRHDQGGRDGRQPDLREGGGQHGPPGGRRAPDLRERRDERGRSKSRRHVQRADRCGACA